MRKWRGGPQRCCNTPASCWIRAQLRVRGQGHVEQGVNASVDPGKPPVHKMGETVLTPPPPAPCEALLDEPLTSTFHHPRAPRQAQFLVYGIVDVRPVPLQRRRYRPPGVP